MAEIHLGFVDVYVCVFMYVYKCVWMCNHVRGGQIDQCWILSVISTLVFET